MVSSIVPLNSASRDGRDSIDLLIHAELLNADFGGNVCGMG